MNGKTGYHHGSLRQVLIDAALDLIARDGIASFSLAQAAARAGVSVAAPYRHFSSKSDLLGAIARLGFEQLSQALSGVPTSDPEETLLEAGIRYVTFAAEHPALFEVMFDNRERAPQSREGLAALAKLGEPLERLAAAGRLTVPVETAVKSAWAMVHGVALLRAGGMLTFAGTDTQTSLRAALRPLLEGGLIRPGS
ncbi:hypothetical protein VE25_04440 [Devosia geojensis]|uniref:HTH tetR-type domain-containing protein n=1 Tax=Devosia geojensis TaxID=443610 RepID=A0A0F5FVW3_9HYPH|nr:hypothetical protein VE25_04440 [Devosia geojensis]